MEASINDLKSELRQTQHELETLRSATAELVSAVIEGMHREEAPSFPAEIRQLASLSGYVEAPASDDPITGEVEAIDVTRQENFAYLDRRFRWLPAARARA